MSTHWQQKKRFEGAVQAGKRSYLHAKKKKKKVSYKTFFFKV